MMYRNYATARQAEGSEEDGEEEEEREVNHVISRQESVEAFRKESVDPALASLKLRWESEQIRLKESCHQKDTEAWQLNRQGHDPGATCADNGCRMEERSAQCIRYVGGTDISFIKGDAVRACASFVVVQLPDCQVVYEDSSMIELTVPYIPGFLAFREAPFFVEKIDKLRHVHPEFVPQAILVDGNGILHVHEFGLACHIGVQVGIPTVGVAKTLYHTDGIAKDEKHQDQIKRLLNKAGDTFPLVGDSGKTYGVAMRCHDKTTNPIYVSAGHNMSLDVAIWLVQLCSFYRVPEPTRQADIRSRQFLRDLEVPVKKGANRKKPTTKKSKINNQSTFVQLATDRSTVTRDLDDQSIDEDLSMLEGLSALENDEM